MGSPISTNLADRVKAFLHSPEEWPRFPEDVREWLEVQQRRSLLPSPEQLLIETFPREGRHYMVVYSFEGWNAHQSLGMLITRRMESSGLMPIGFVANDYAIATYSAVPLTDPAALLSPDILEHEFVDWVQQSHLLKTAFREVAVIGGVGGRQQPRQRKNRRRGTLSPPPLYHRPRGCPAPPQLPPAAPGPARGRRTEI